MSILIRTAVPTDAPVIVDYNQRIARETENKSLPDAVIGDGVAGILQDTSRGIYYVACIDDQVIGQLMITLEWSDWRNGWFWWIQSVYVNDAYRQHGVFRALYEHVKQRAQAAQNVCGIRLYVEHNNTRAQQTYASLGMDKTHYQIMEEEF